MEQNLLFNSYIHGTMIHIKILILRAENETFILHRNLPIRKLFCDNLIAVARKGPLEALNAPIFKQGEIQK